MRRYFESSAAVGLVAIVFALMIVAPASAQLPSSWISTAVGSAGAAGSATFNNGIWTISGDGSDIWGTADSFQFLHQRPSSTGFVTARIDDLQNTSPFAKAGVMFRTSTTANGATAILDVKPNGEIEFMARPSTGAPMQFIATATVTLPVWLRLQTSGAGITASTSQDGITWTMLQGSASVAEQFLEAGVAVTSHDPGQLNTAHVSHLTLDPVLSGSANRFVGFAGQPGTVLSDSGSFVVTGEGSDIWGTADAFTFLYQHTAGNDQHLRVRVESLDDRHPFAKAGLMVRDSLDPDSPMVIVDVKPDGGIEFMTRSALSGETTYLGGANVTFPAWLDLSWRSVPGAPGVATFSAAVSQDKVTWTPVPGSASLMLPNTLYEVGLAVTSHFPTVFTTAVVRGLSLTPIDAASDDIGSTGLVGNATTDITRCCNAAVVQGSGADIWGTADSFQFAHATGGTPTTPGNTVVFRVMSIQGASNPFAKAGLMVRDSLNPDAAHVILDIRPGGDIEFMARTCTGCETTFLNTAHVITFPVLFQLTRTGNTYEAFYYAGGFQSLGTVDVPMAQPIPGYAVTSHDTTRIATAVFDMPPP